MIGLEMVGRLLIGISCEAEEGAFPLIWKPLSPCNTQLRISFREGGYTPKSPYKSVETLFSPWLSLDLLRGSLDVQEVNTGKEYNILGPSGIVTDDVDGLHGFTDEESRFVLRSGIEWPFVATAPGVMYRVPPFFYVPGQSEATFRDVGWQPLHRPAQQRAAAFRLKKGVDFVALPRVEKVLFSHSARVSTRIWKSFDGGKALFPDDAPAQLSERAKGLHQFTREQIDLAWGRFDAWHGAVSDPGKRQRLETAAGLAVVDAPVLSWDGLDVERDESKLRDELNEVMSRVRFRWASYG